MKPSRLRAMLAALGIASATAREPSIVTPEPLEAPPAPPPEPEPEPSPTARERLIEAAHGVRRLLDQGLSTKIGNRTRRAFGMPHQGNREAARRVEQGKAGTGGPWHERHGAEVGNVRCGCRQCVQARREALQS